ncbi:MAG TPA: AAA family ATPase [Acidimicrobiales bacterium]|nr:AAA family ATPase [Acidimicrobiales bacterium]
MRKIAVAGKGGSGKTTIAGLLARVVAEGGHDVLTVDADENPNLGISLGLGVDATYGLIGVREALYADGPAIATSMEEVVERFATPAGDNLRIVQVRKFDHFRPG